MKCLRLISSALFSLVLLLTSCAPMGKESAAYELHEDSEAPMISRSEAAPSLGAISDGATVSDDIALPAEEPGADTERLRIYNGSAGLIVENTEDTRTDLEKITRDSGGYVESSYSDYLVLRVPAEDFEEIFKLILTMGTVDYSRVETWDVTEAFADTERQLLTAEETRNRLYVLLERSTDSTERARILREIGRLTEEIESLKQQLSTLTARIAYSRITVQLTPRVQGDFSRENIPFSWIAYLDPLFPAGSKLKGKLNLNPGDEFAVFTRESVYMAESSDGLSIVVSTVENSPRGDNEFWHRALIFHLEPYYSSLNEMSIMLGSRELPGVELVSKDREPFKYFVGVIADGRNLHIVEIFSPDSSISFDSLYDALAEGDLK